MASCFGPVELLFLRPFLFLTRLLLFDDGVIGDAACSTFAAGSESLSVVRAAYCTALHGRSAAHCLDTLCLTIPYL